MKKSINTYLRILSILLVVLMPLSMEAQNFKDGYHEFVYPNGNVYKGKWKTGKKDGKGTMYYANGDIYEGEWKDDMRNGQGTFTQAHGGKAKGEWKNDILWNGNYSKYRIDDWEWTGYVKDGKMQGHGIEAFYEEDTIVEKYEGEWKDDKQDGQGTEVRYEGDSIKWTYTGMYKNGYKDGHGVLYDADGNIINEGEWKDGVFWNGKMKKYRLDDETELTGEIVDGMIQHVTIVVYDKDSSLYAMYDGGFKNNMMDGKGIYIDSKGDTYDGYYESNCKKGDGKITQKGGGIADGTWENNVLWHGNLDSFIIDGECKYTGTIENGMIQGKGTITYYAGNHKGEKYEGNFDGFLCSPEYIFLSSDNTHKNTDTDVVRYVNQLNVAVSDWTTNKKRTDDIATKIKVENLSDNDKCLYYLCRIRDNGLLKNDSLLIQQACELENSKYYGLALMENVGFLLEKERYEEADSCYQKAEAIINSLYNPLPVPQKISTRLEIQKAKIENGLGRIDKAMHLLEDIIAKEKHRINESRNHHPYNYYSAVSKLYYIYINKGLEEQNDTLKKEYFDKAVKELEDYGKNVDRSGISYPLVLSCYFTDNKEKMEQALNEANELHKNYCLDAFSNFTPSDCENLWDRVSWKLMYMNNLAGSKYEEFTAYAYDNALFVKNLATLSNDILQKLVKESNEKRVQQKFERAKQSLGKLAVNPNDQKADKEYKSSFEELIKEFPQYREELSESFKTWEAVRDNLGDLDIAIEFIYIPDYPQKLYVSKDSVKFHYGALVLRNNDEHPVLVELCKKEDLNKLLEKKKNQEQIGFLYTSTQLYNFIWQPLEPYIQEKNTIYFSPTGALNFINHNAIVMPNGNRLSEKYNLVRLSSTSKIEEVKKNAVKDYDSALLYGEIFYNPDIEEWQEAVAKVETGMSNKPYNMIDLALVADSGGNSNDERGEFDVLYATGPESNKISIILGNSLGEENVKLFQHTDAVEETFKAIDHRAPSIIHLATHAKFADKQEDLNTYFFLRDAQKGYSKQANLLKRTWLLMAGAEYIYKNKGNHLPEGVRDDGFLTAEEISRMDLRGAKLVVMSACETGKGFENIDGIVGLQRGFKKAGAETIVMSLWTVNDESTSYLMQQFYTHLITDKMPAREALKQAMEDTREHEENGAFPWKDPYFWAGFVVLD